MRERLEKETEGEGGEQVRGSSFFFPLVFGGKQQDWTSIQRCELVDLSFFPIFFFSRVGGLVWVLLYKKLKDSLPRSSHLKVRAGETRAKGGKRGENTQ